MIANLTKGEKKKNRVKVLIIRYGLDDKLIVNRIIRPDSFTAPMETENNSIVDDFGSNKTLNNPEYATNAETVPENVLENVPKNRSKNNLRTHKGDSDAVNGVSSLDNLEIVKNAVGVPEDVPPNGDSKSTARKRKIDSNNAHEVKRSLRPRGGNKPQ